MIFKCLIICLIILIKENNRIREFYTFRKSREIRETIEQEERKNQTEELEKQSRVR